MHSQVDAISPILVEVKLEFPWATVNENLETAYRKLQRTAQVRGFRPGKVPRNVVHNLMGKAVEREVASRLFEEGLGEAVRKHAIDAIAVSDMQPPVIAQGQPLQFNVKVEVRPKIETVKTDALTIKRKLDPITEEQIDHEIEGLRNQNAELVVPSPMRPAQTGDSLTLQIDVSVAGQPRPEMGSTDTRAVLGENRLLAELEEGLVGASVGEDKLIDLVFPDNYSHEPLRGKKAVFKIRIKELQAKVLPALDDEFARDLSHASLAAMRDDVRGKLQELAQRRSEASLREQVLDRLIDINPIPVPPSLIERQEQAMRAELEQLQQMFGQPLPWNTEMQAQMRVSAERKVRAGLLLGAIAEQQKFTITDEDLETKFAQIADQSGKHIAKVKAEHQGKQRDGLRNQLLQDRLLGYLLSQAKVSDLGPEDETASEDTAEAQTAAAQPAAKSKPKASKAAAESKPSKAKAEPKEAAPKAKTSKPRAPKKSG